jgi:hypothetical protein
MYSMERNTNEYSELFYHCVQVLNEYNDKISEEIFLEEYFQLNKVCCVCIDLKYERFSCQRFLINHLCR